MTWEIPVLLCPKMFLVLVLAGLTITQSRTASSQEIKDCQAANDHLQGVMAAVNYCERADDCTAVAYNSNRSVGCGTLFNKAKRAEIETAIEVYAQFCFPHWHCLGWAADHRVTCVENRCEWHRKQDRGLLPQ